MFVTALDRKTVDTMVPGSPMRVEPRRCSLSSEG